MDGEKHQPNTSPRKNPIGTKGYTGNPNGRPKKGLALTDLLSKYLAKKDAGDAVTRKQKLVEALFEGAMPRKILDADGNLIDIKPGDPALLKYIFDRIDGRPDIFQQIVGEGLPQVVIVMPDDADE